MQPSDDVLKQIEDTLAGAGVKTPQEDTAESYDQLYERYMRAMEAKIDTVRTMRDLAKSGDTCATARGFSHYVRYVEAEALELATRMIVHRKSHEKRSS